MRDADRVMDDYSLLDEDEKAKFDKRYRELMKFRRSLNTLVAAVQARKRGEGDSKKK